MADGYVPLFHCSYWAVQLEKLNHASTFVRSLKFERHRRDADVWKCKDLAREFEDKPSNFKVVQVLSTLVTLNSGRELINVWRRV